MKTHYFQKKPLFTPSRPLRPAVVPHLVSTTSNTRADIRRILRGPLLQTKLTVGAPDDVYEQEADRVTDEVMRMPEPRLQTTPTCNAAACPQVEEETIQPKALSDQITPLVQRQIEEEEEEEELIQTKALNGVTDLTPQRQPEEEEEELLTTKEVAGQFPQVTPNVASTIASMRAGGQPLPAAERELFEPRFGVDFSKVRLHINQPAAEAAKAVSARAFTFGNDVYFGAGQYAPASSEGKRLLAHELTHVMQQQKLSAQDQRLQRQGVDIGEDIDENMEPDIDESGPDNVVTEEFDLEGIQFDDGVHVLWFQFDSAEFRQDSEIDSEANLELAMALILQHSTVAGDQQTITLDGYASEEGSKEHNMALSLIRAERVRSTLIQTGVPPERISVKAHGRDSTFKGLHMNRRVEIVLRPTLTHIKMSPRYVAAVPCICHSQRGGALKEESIQYVASIAPTIIAVSRKRKVSPVAVAGAIAEEYDTRHGFHGIVDWFQDNVLPLQPGWMIDIQRIPDFHNKLQNTLEHDVGNANIHVRTALELVESGRLEVEGSPATDAQVNLIVDYIIDERGMVEASAAVIEQGQSLFDPYIRDYDIGFQDAILVDFFNIGYEKYYQENFLGNLAKNPQHRPCPDPNGDGCQVLQNRDRIESALEQKSP